MKKFLLNTIYKIFIIVTLPIAILEILCKNLFYGLQLSWWDLQRERKFVWGAVKWGIDQDQKKFEETIRKKGE